MTEILLTLAQFGICFMCAWRFFDVTDPALKAIFLVLGGGNALFLVVRILQMEGVLN